MADIARLGIQVDGTQLVAADRALEHFGQTAARTQQTVTPLVARVDDLGKRGVVATQGVGQVNSALRQLAIQASGANPVIGRLVASVGMFALGSVAMTGVLAGAAALGVAWHRMRDSAREAREEAERLNAVLDAIAAKGGPGEVPGATRASEFELARLTAERRRLEGLRDRFGANDYFDSKISELAYQASLVRNRVNAGVGSMGVGGVLDAVGSPIDNRQSNFFAQRDREAQQAREMMRGLIEMQRGRYDNIGNANRLTFDGRYGYQGSNAGAVNIAGAQQNLANMTSGRGGGGGGISWAMGSGAAGGLDTVFSSIAGSVTGFIQTMGESAQKAEEARRRWRVTLSDYALMFDELTPTESRLNQAQRGLEDLAENLRQSLGTGLLMPTKTEIEAYLADPLLGPTNAYTVALQALYDTYLLNADQATTLAAAERDLYDARFRSLNAPQGFNLAYFGYRAGAGFTDPKAAAKSLREQSRRGGDPLNLTSR